MILRPIYIALAGMAGFSLASAAHAQEIDESVLPSFEEGMGLTGDEPVTEEEIGRIFTIDPEGREILDGRANASFGDIDREVVEQVETANGAVLRGLDRVSTGFDDYEVKNGTSTKVGPLLVTLGECRYPADNPSGEAYAYLTIKDELVGQMVFEGWMMASAPALNALDHSRYDVWVLRCTIDAPEGTEESE
ncbi:DUF2155 domain-containing protein [Halocynthiibacter sp. C4]|uniref:DUF2155 domain-containing protein n=1 Tax=Halocynthiibacter sp. C4 TaxID=2992758 RepID=UPI00237A9140|nr:DUF2155 domain-containing protein [Halocynthiibacter sp. C4]MDE0590061.1 DUF2155 domain-containing protein [Halocynthiibacter sp. C4]